MTVAGPGGDFLPGITSDGQPQLRVRLRPEHCKGTSTPPTYSFCWAVGTSMATPAVSGVAALIKSVNPGISLGALKAKLKNTADDEGPIGNDEFYGHGFVNAFRACTQ